MSTILDLPVDIIHSLLPYLGRPDVINFQGVSKQPLDDTPEAVYSITSISHLISKYKNWSRVRNVDISAITKVKDKYEWAVLKWLFLYCQIDRLAIHADLLNLLFQEKKSIGGVLFRCELKPGVEEQSLWHTLKQLKITGDIRRQQLQQVVAICPQLTHLESHWLVMESDLPAHITHYTETASHVYCMIENPHLTDLTFNITNIHPELIIKCPSLLRLTINDKRVNSGRLNAHFEFVCPKLKYITFGVNKEGNHPQVLLDLYEKNFSHVYLQPTPTRMNLNRKAALNRLLITAHAVADAKASAIPQHFNYETPPQTTRRIAWKTSVT